MNSKGNIAAAKFLEGYNCSQSVLYAFCDSLNIDTDLALKIACGFGAGMGRKEEVCGAVTGGIAAIGAKFGRGEHDGPEFTEITYKKIRELMDQFAEKMGSFICRELVQGCELTTDEGQAFYMQNNLRNTTCKLCVHTAADVVEKIIE